MKLSQISLLGWIAIGLAELGSIAALLNEFLGHQRGKPLDWGHIALAIGVPLLMFAIVWSSSKKQD